MSEEHQATSAVAETTSTINVATKSVTISTTTSANAVAVVKPVEPEEPRIKLSDVVTTKKDAKALSDLIEMFDHCRPHDSKATLDFALKWLKPLGAKIDARGNWTLRIGEDSKVIWSSHIDTVDWNEGPKNVVLSHTTGVLRLSDKDKSSSCLGADCTTGVWIMREMAKAKVPGLYIWHEAEESGGQGSSWIAKHKPELLKGMQAAIAFDRKGFSDIITEQSGGMCCSDEFAKALAKQLPNTGFKPDSTGSFTDTANYTDVIPECTNLSVGYFGQHCKTETQNVIFAMLMRAAMVRFDETKLVIKRKPGEGAYTYGRYYGMGYSGRQYNSMGYPNDRYYDDWEMGGFGGSSYKEPPRAYVLTGDRVRIRQAAVTAGLATQELVGCEGNVTQICYKDPKSLTIKMDSGGWLEGLQEHHVDRVIEEKYALDANERRSGSERQPVKPAAKVHAFKLDDRVIVKEAARFELAQRQLKRPLCDIIGKVGTVSGLGLRSDWIDVKMDSGQMLFSLKSFDLTPVGTPDLPHGHGNVTTKVAKPKDYSKTKCGGLCGGKCKGLCASMKKPDVMAKVDAEKELARKDANAAIRRLGESDHDAKLAKLIEEDRLYPKEPADERMALTLRDFIINYPDQIVDWMEQMGMTVDDLYDTYPDCL